MAKLLKLHLENYRNIKSIDINFDGKDGKITGMNRTGKTNILESICFLLTDKLLGGSADIPAIKCQSDTKAIVVVEGVFSTSEGEVTLRKEFAENWVRPRGSATEVLAGHYTDYFINGAKQSRAKDFFEQLTAKFGVPTDFNGLDAYELIIDPFYLAQTVCDSKDWKNARKAVIEIVGDVTPEEIYLADKDAKIADDDLKRHQFDTGEAKKAIRGEIDGYKAKMQSNTSLLEEYSKSEDVPEEEYQAAKTEDETISDQISKLKNGSANPFADEVTKLQKELSDKQIEYSKIVTAPVDHTKSEALRKQINEKQTTLFDLKRQANDSKEKADNLKSKIERQRETLETYIAQLNDLKSQYNSIMVSETCPTCGQPLPKEKIQAAFNAKRAEISGRASCTHEQALNLKKVLKEEEEMQKALISVNLDGEIEVANVDISDLQNKLKVACETEDKAVVLPDPKIQERIKAINARLAEIDLAKAKGNEGSLEQIQELKVKKEALQVKFSKRISFNNAQKRIEEIKAENVAAGKEEADAEQRLWAVGEFIKTKLSLLDKHMAEKLGEVRFQLIKENIKAGSYDEVCTPFIISPITGKHTDTLFDSGSKSEQIYTGCQIIKAIRNAKNWAPLPVLFDQGGELDPVSVQKVSLDSEAQIIAVKVEGTNEKPIFVPFAN